MSDVKGKVLKHGEQTRMMHWIHFITFSILSITGLAFYFNLDFIHNIFGGPANASNVHVWTGVVFAVGPAIYIILNFERFAKFIDTISTFTKDDFIWLKTMGGYIPFLKGEIPPQDKYNAGQKMLGWIVIFGCLILIITGFAMWIWRFDASPLFLYWSWTIHFWVAILMILAVGGHFFLAAIHPKSRVEFSSMMIDGYVDAEFTAHHNEKWFKSLDKK